MFDWCISYYNWLLYKHYFVKTFFIAWIYYFIFVDFFEVIIFYLWIKMLNVWLYLYK